MGDGVHWQGISGELPLNDGARVLVRQGPDGAQRALIFRARPAPRWESPNGFHVWDFRYFTQWRSTAEPFGSSTTDGLLPHRGGVLPKSQMIAHLQDRERTSAAGA